MKTFSFSLFLLLLTSVCSRGVLQAQNSRNLQYREFPTARQKIQRFFSVGAYLGGFNYFGDLAPTNSIGSTYLPLTRAGFGVEGTYRFRKHFSVRTGLMWGRLRGDDITADKHDEDGKFRYARNLHFRNDVKELSVDLVFDIYASHRSFASRKKFSPYLFLGVAFFHHNPKARLPAMDALHYNIMEAKIIDPADERYTFSPGDWVALKPLGTEGQYLPGSGVNPYSNWQFAIPAGVGVRYRLNRYFDLGLEVGLRQTFTDYLDDVSGYYINPGDFGNGPEANLSRIMADRSKEPVAAVDGRARDLQYIMGHIHGTTEFGQVPDGFEPRPYVLIVGYGKAGADNIRGKEAYDIYVATKITVRYYIEADFGLRQVMFR